MKMAQAENSNLKIQSEFYFLQRFDSHGRGGNGRAAAIQPLGLDGLK